MRKKFEISHRTIISLALALTLSATTAVKTPAVTTSQTGSDPALQRLEREIARLSTVSGGVVGVTAIHLETGRRVSMNGTQRFPMASTFKVPIAVQLLTRIDKGEVKLDQMIDIKQSDLHPGSGTLADLFNKGGLALSVRNLMELMLLISDNSATDVMLRTAGGAEAVTARMRSLGIEGINVNRSTAQLIADWIGVT
ncbi:MAG TPA: serine hydrolase, partial [Blastocatellia bacterium]|nr:serine hydrolase [Blastocatellia bacterium]